MQHYTVSKDSCKLEDYFSGDELFQIQSLHKLYNGVVKAEHTEVTVIVEPAEGTDMFKRDYPAMLLPIKL